MYAHEKKSSVAAEVWENATLCLHFWFKAASD
jgi:hypothetical protein